jgi:signal transduction histidine kinase
MRAEVRERTHVHADVWSALDPLPEGPEALRDEITAGTEPKIVPVSDERIDVYTIVNDVRDQPTLILRSSFDRAILAGTNRILDFALLSTVATALIILLVLLRLLDRIVLRPLSRLTRHAAEIGRTEDMSRRVAMERHDELGKLSDEFDGLMGKLQHSREQVIETARVAGMSEIATGILHNVGNVLNSVNVSTNLAVAKAERLAVRDLQAMTDLLIEHRDDLGRFVSEDPRGRQFLPFLGELTREMSAQRESIVNELRSLGHGVDHVIELVRNQQSYAGMSAVFEPTDLAAAINAALAICEQAYTLRGDIEIVREYEELPRVAVDKHKLMEILVNLIQNAGQIMRDAETPQKRLTCRLRRDGENTVRIEVEDNGPGIAVANLARIFAHGFTTRPGGHGFGLHVSANAATEMKASLHARSDGPGTGATFVLQLPLKTNEVALAA